MAHRRRRRRHGQKFGPSAPATSTSSDDGNVSQPSADAVSNDNEVENDDNQGDD